MIAALAALLLIGPPGVQAAETADSIMARVAENQDRAQQMRTAFVFNQNVLVRLNRTNGKLAREEVSDFIVTPTADGVRREQTSFSGKLVEGKKTIEFSESGWEHKNLDIDAAIAHGFAEDFGSDNHNKDGIAHDLFPLRGAEQRKYIFKLEGSEEYRGFPVYRITFEPRTKHSVIDDDGDKGSWAGEVLVHRAEFQPVLITTRLAAKIPLWVKTALGTDVQQLGFKITYQKFDEGLWFPVNYGGEFKVRALFLYARKIGISVRNSDFQRAAVDSKVSFATVQ
ncbi:MAG: hypothetical protein ABI823_11215 [Bryobacteraceae bacterium]